MTQRSILTFLTYINIQNNIIHGAPINGVYVIEPYGRVNIQNNIIAVKGPDVISDTPILDIKPYTPQYDAVADAKVPKWISKLEYKINHFTIHII